MGRTKREGGVEKGWKGDSNARGRIVEKKIVNRDTRPNSLRDARLIEKEKHKLKVRETREGQKLREKS